VPLYQVDFWLYILIAAFVLHQLWFWLLWVKPLYLKGEKEQNGQLPAVSVIVAAKNEKENLQKLVPAVLNQDYPEFELIVVDDHSWDGTYEYIHEMMPVHKNLHVVSLNEFVQSKPGKKLALTLGIKKARHEILIFTDADCTPASDNWLKQMANSYESDQTEIVLGYSPIRPKASPLNLIVRFEAFNTMWQYAAFALAKLPYMGVGRNLSYKKSTFLANKGFAKNLKVPFGDDDLLVQEMAHSGNTSLVLSSDSHVYTNSPKGVLKWISQKRRHLSAGKYYKGKFTALLGLGWLCKVLIYSVAILYFILGPMHVAGLSLAILPLLAMWLLSFLFHRKSNVFSVWYVYPLLELLYQLLIYPLLGVITALHPKKVNW